MFIKDVLNSDNRISKKEKIIILSHLLNKPNLIIDTKEKISKDIFLQYKIISNQYLSGKPLQYIIGKTNFYGYDFIINEKVLIPRFETEELVEKTISYINSKFGGKGELIDLGCGSGVIGLTIKKECPKINVTLLDISEDALKIARLNKQQLNVKANIIKGDMLDNITSKYDIIVSNPPYIRLNETIDKLVKENEPHLALYGGDNGLKYYSQILKKAKDVVKDNFLIALEIGSDQGNKIIKIINEHFSNIIIRIEKDLQNRNRMIFITNKIE
ncbi:MAG: peptide chain release factor N(5)-glutamine methyltransferase [Tenericutes bacterium]|jgi:release factor glutamine methyltransferase|nr:peptide chain release factor N(5)-glutamine methyltransferase [Mycoplasmatota bacterium]